MHHTGTCRKIIHIDMDAFYASVEQRDHPWLKGKPVAVGGAGERGVVAAASYEARRFGVRSAMPGKTAIKRCPELMFVPARFDIYKKVSLQIREIFLEYTPLVEPLSLDEAYLDVTHPLKGKHSATLIANEIRQRIYETTGLTASAGVSYNKFLAKIASDVNKPNGIFIIRPQDASGFIEKLAIGKFHGVGAVTAQKFNNLGIFTGLDLKEAGKEFVIKHFGRNGLFFYDIAHGNDPRAVEPHRDRKSVGAENTFEKDLLDAEALNREIAVLADILFERLRRAGIWGNTLTLKIKYFDFVQVTRSKTFALEISTREEMYRIACDLLHEHRIEDKPIRLLGISFSQLEYAGAKPGKQLRFPF
jgi:DNA polymerase IV